jgi:hypothetical protein
LLQTNLLEEGIDLPETVTETEPARIQNEGEIVAGRYLVLEVSVSFPAYPFVTVSLHGGPVAPSRANDDPVPRQIVSNV